MDQAAGLAGISKPYLSRLERGERPIDSRGLLLQIATALEVSVTDLTGQPYAPRDRQHADAHRGVVGTRLALLDPEGPAQPEERILEAVDGLAALMNSCDLVEQARAIPDLLRWTQQSAAASRTPEAYRRVAVAAHAATFFMRNLGELDLAWMAAERMRSAADQAGDQATRAFAAYTQAHSLAPSGAVRRASAVATEAVDLTTGAGDEELAARGSCLLVSAYTSSTLGDLEGARDRLSEAAELAQVLTSPTLVASYTSFSSWNVIMHRVSVEVEAGNSATAVEAARPLTSAPVAQRERMSYLWVDVGRAFAQMDRHREAIDAFRRAERTAPLRVRLSPVVRDSVRDLLDRAYRRASGAELRGLAERCGVFTDL